MCCCWKRAIFQIVKIMLKWLQINIEFFLWGYNPYLPRVPFLLQQVSSTPSTDSKCQFESPPYLKKDRHEPDKSHLDSGSLGSTRTAHTWWTWGYSIHLPVWTAFECKVKRKYGTPLVWPEVEGLFFLIMSEIYGNWRSILMNYDGRWWWRHVHSQKKHGIFICC